MKYVFVFVLAVVSFLLVQAAQGADTVIGFDDLPSGTAVSNQYASAGVVFAGIETTPSIIQLPSGVAQSGTQALNITAVAEVSVTGLSGHFSSTRQHVSAFVGDWGTMTHPVTLAIYDASGDAIDEKTVTVTGGAGIHTQVTVSSSSENVRSFRIFIPGPQAPFARVAIDNFSFDNPATPPAPDFGIAWADGAGVGLAPGGSFVTYIGVTLVNGSSGALEFTTSGLPQGVSVSFSANQTNFADGAQVALTFVANSVAAPVATTLTIVATPQNSGAGPGPHSVQIPLVVFGIYTLRVQGIEVTQGIQCFGYNQQNNSCNSALGVPSRTGFGTTATYNGVPLFPQKATVARVFVDAANAPAGGVSGTTVLLHGFDSANNELSASPLLPLSSPLPLVDSQSPNVTPSEQLNTNGAFDFLLPWQWTQSGAISLRAELLVPPPSFGPPAIAVPCSDPINCLPLTKLTLTNITFSRIFPNDQFAIDPIKLTVQNNPDPPPVGTVLTTVAKLTPQTIVAGDYLTQYDITWIMNGCPLNLFGEPPLLTCPQRNDKSLAVLNMLDDWFQNNDHPLYGDNMVLGVMAGPVNGTDLGMESNTIDSDVALGVASASRPKTSVSHEIHHGFGRVHASPCQTATSGSVGTNEPWPPDNQGFIQGIALDVASQPPFIVNAPGVTGEPTNWFDFMGYCANPNDTDSWISIKGWNEIIRPVIAGAALQTQASSSSASNAPALRVRASVDSQGQVRIISVTTRVFKRVASGTASPYDLVVRDRAGTVVASVQMLLQSVHIDDSPDGTLLQAEAPVQNAASVEIVRNGRVLASESRSTAPVEITITRPRAGERVGDAGQVFVAWTTTGGDGRPLLANVDYSADGGHTWKPLFAGHNVNSATLPSALVSASTGGRIRVRINDGFSEAMAISEPINAAGAPPIVRIERPAGRAVLWSDTTLLLEGAAFDDESHPLTGADLHWFSVSATSGSRPLGTGGKISVTNLPPDVTSIRLEARDANGRVGKASVELQIVPQAPFFTVLDAPKTLRSKDTSVELRVAASRVATLAIGDSRFSVTTLPAPITIPVPATTKILRLDLQLTADGMARHGFLRIVREPDPCQSIEDAISSTNQEITTVQDELSNPDLPPGARAALGKQLRLLNETLSSDETQLQNCEQQHP